MNRVLYTYDDLSRSDASLPTSLVSSITYVMRCRRYVMTMTRQTRRIIGGIAVTVSIPHRFPYGSLLLFSLSLFFCVTHAPSSSILPIDRYCCVGFLRSPIARGLIGGSRDIESDDSPRSKRGPRLLSFDVSYSDFYRYIRPRCTTKMYFSREGCTMD